MTSVQSEVSAYNTFGPVVFPDTQDYQTCISADGGKEWTEFSAPNSLVKVIGTYSHFASPTHVST